VSERTIYRLLDAGGLEAVRVGGRWRIPPGALEGLAGRRLIEPKLEVEAAASAAIDVVLGRALQEGFRRYFYEDDFNADLAAELRARLRADLVETHLELETAGAAGRQRPDLSVIPALGSFADRRGAAAYFSAEAKYFSYRGNWGRYELNDPLFLNLLEKMERQFVRMRDRVRLGLLGAGALIWLDAFDWARRVPEERREEVVSDRARWVRDHFAAPESRVRVDYLPLLFPPRRVTLLNGLPAGQPAARAPGSLRGAAAPFIRRIPAADERWDELIEESAAEAWRAKSES
jgi:excisionase family DNA binding protein